MVKLTSGLVVGVAVPAAVAAVALLSSPSSVADAFSINSGIVVQRLQRLDLPSSSSSSSSSVALFMNPPPAVDEEIKTEKMTINGDNAGQLSSSTTSSDSAAAAAASTDDGEEELSETKKLLKQVKEAGTAGVISYALWELAFWFISVPVCAVGFREVTGHWPDFTNKEDLEKLGAEAFAFVNFARFAVPLRIGLALSTTPWIDNNIVKKYFNKEEEEGNGADNADATN
eukprot:CAMPEP_0113458138 /NCGR_PEP_ID=MMETSP0014_2-20120614/9766_1 /TAXON_ID=2857 /ORGANISM="Nitzschia sp." /LENGTH=228 /DNA_ID=CAMNT_0000349649 /DNA_START=140 /DNA_END=826 /DNA_ORIENTATION=+ /assembly_acc=CAM_ASM_000159